MSREYKCWYKKCKHGGKVTDDEAVSIGTKRYHKQCKLDQEYLKKARELYIEYIQPSVVHAQLNKVINDLIENKKIEPEYLLFVIEYIIDNELELNYPFGLHYKVADFKIQRAYNGQNKKTNLTIYS